MSSIPTFKQHGFTIVEVLTIVVIVGILATIGVVSYNGYTQRANDTAIRSDLDSAAGLLEAYRVRASNTTQTFPDSSGLEGIGVIATVDAYNQDVESNFIYCLPADYQSFSIAALSKSGNIFLMTQDGFISPALAPDDFNNETALCTSLGQSHEIESGMLEPGVWATWVGGTGSGGGEEGDD